jgi:hypothetical protein
LHPSQLTRDVLKVLPDVPSSVFGVTKVGVSHSFEDAR